MYVTPTYIVDGALNFRDGAEAKMSGQERTIKIVIFTYNAFEFIDNNSIKLYNLHYSRIKSF